MSFIEILESEHYPIIEAIEHGSSDPEIIKSLKEELYNIIAKHSGQTYDKVYEDSDRDYWMKADKALEYGMIDEILARD